MTAEEISREVRARLVWGHSVNRIRSELLRAGANAAMLDEVLRGHLRIANAESRWKGLLGLFAAAALLWGAYQIGSPLLPRQAEPPADVVDIDVVRALPGRDQAWRPALALGLLVAGAVSLATGAHRLVSGRRGDAT